MNNRIAETHRCVLQFLEHEKIPFPLFTGKTVRIEPATSLFIISRPVVDAIVRK